MAGGSRLPVVQAQADRAAVVRDRRREARELLGPEAVRDPAGDVDRDVRISGLEAQQADRAGDVPVGRVEALERSARVRHRGEGVRELGELRPREAGPRARAPLEPARVEGNDRERRVSRRTAHSASELDRALRAQRDVAQRRSLDVEADPVERLPAAGAERQHGQRAPRIAGRIDVPRQVPGDDLDASSRAAPRRTGRAAPP